MTASELYQAGKLKDAIDAAIGEVKKKPTDLEPRYLLAQLLCFSGDLERADGHLDAIVTQEPDRVVVVSMFRQLIRCERWRRQVFDEGRAPELVVDPSPAISAHLEALLAIREGRTVDAVEALRRAEEARPAVSGTCDGVAFEGLRDLDDVTSSFLEVLSSNGKYFWIPLERVELLEFHAAETLFDLVWRRVHMVVREGPDGEVFIPTMYIGTHLETDDALRLGRATDWRGEEQNLLRGVGQRLLLVGEDDKAIMDIQELTINAVAD